MVNTFNKPYNNITSKQNTVRKDTRMIIEIKMYDYKIELNPWLCLSLVLLCVNRTTNNRPPFLKYNRS